MKKNILANVMGRFWGVLSNFLFIPLYIKYLGFESFSIISFSLVIAGLMAVLDAGLSATLSREFAKANTTLVDKIRVFRTLESSYFIIISIVIIIVFLSSGLIASHAINLNTFSANEVSYYIKIISFDIGFQLLLKFYLGGLLGLEKQVKANVFLIFWGVFRNGLVVLAIIYRPTLEMFFAWQAVFTVLFAIVFRFLLYQELVGRYSFELKFKIEKEIFKKIWKFAGGMLLISLVAALNTQLDKMAISRLLPVESLGYYTLAVSLATGIFVLVNPISIATLPRFTALYSEGNLLEASKLYNKISLLLAILVFSIMVNMIFFSERLIWIWTGDVSLSQKANVFLPVLALAFSMLAMATVSYNIVVANAYTKLNNILGLASLFFTLPGYWYMTKIYGALGAAIVFCAVQTIITTVYIYYINKKFLHQELTTVFFRNLILPLFTSLSVVFCFSFVPNLVSENRIFMLIWIGFSVLVAIIISLMLLLSKSEKLMILKFKK